MIEAVEFIAVVSFVFVCCLAHGLNVSLRRTTAQLVTMNERLMVMATVKESGEAAARLLVASAKPPQGIVTPGVSEGMKSSVSTKEGVTVSYGFDMNGL